jgi:N-acetylglucosamine kinase-like BadF-type ATPase
VADGQAAVLAIDGGNSKTDVALIGWDGTVLCALRGPGASQNEYGIDGARSRLADLIRMVAEKAGIDGSGIVAPHISACLAGADLPEEEQALTAALLSGGWSHTAVAMNDAFAILRGGVDEPWGVAVTCGAGINCVAVAPDGTTARYLSLGTMTGDWGGGRGLGKAVMWHAMRGWDGRGRATALGDAVAVHFGLASVRDVAVAVHKGVLGENDLVPLTAVLFAVAADGDPVARSLVDRQAAEICAMATAAMRRLGMAPAGVPVVLGGGLLESRDPLLLSEIERQFAEAAPGATARLLDVPPIAGAALLGLDYVGAPTTPKLRLRACYRALNGTTKTGRRGLPCSERRRLKSRRHAPHPPQMLRPRRPGPCCVANGPLTKPATTQSTCGSRCPTSKKVKLERHRVASSEICRPVCRCGPIRYWGTICPGLGSRY